MCRATRVEANVIERQDVKARRSRGRLSAKIALLSRLVVPIHWFQRGAALAKTITVHRHTIAPHFLRSTRVNLRVASPEQMFRYPWYTFRYPRFCRTFLDETSFDEAYSTAVSFLYLIGFLYESFLILINVEVEIFCIIREFFYFFVRKEARLLITRSHMKMLQKNLSVSNLEKKCVKFRSRRSTVNDKNSKILEWSLIYVYEVNIRSRVILSPQRCYYRQTSLLSLQFSAFKFHWIWLKLESRTSILIRIILFRQFSGRLPSYLRPLSRFPYVFPMHDASESMLIRGQAGGGSMTAFDSSRFSGSYALRERHLPGGKIEIHRRR